MSVPHNYGQEGLPVFHIMSCIKAESAGLTLPALFWKLFFYDQIWVGSLPLSIQLILWALRHYNCQSFPSIKGFIWKAQWKSHILHETALIYVFPLLSLKGITVLRGSDTAFQRAGGDTGNLYVVFSVSCFCSVNICQQQVGGTNCKIGPQRLHLKIGGWRVLSGFFLPRVPHRHVLSNYSRLEGSNWGWNEKKDNKLLKCPGLLERNYFYSISNVDSSLLGPSLATYTL